MIIDNVTDRRYGWIGSWEVQPLVVADLHPEDAGRTVIYVDRYRPALRQAEAGTLSSWRDGRVWARFTMGDTAAACNPADLFLAVQPMDGDQSRLRV